MFINYVLGSWRGIKSNTDVEVRQGLYFSKNMEEYYLSMEVQLETKNNIKNMLEHLSLILGK